ncbi:MFS transporter [Agreia sp. Leaf335]|uniref:MFS transporter n=1 Tax=Agreia sp. Leaf335 TaxID=1736340 RepID=UPI000A72ADD6|nr:MFS transporter [Agreia sp. Leaf335]
MVDHGRTLARASAPTPAAVSSLFILFASMGTTSAAIPAMIPSLAASGTGVLGDYLRAVPALFFGLLAGVLISSVLGKSLSPRRVTILGAGIQAVGFIALSVSSVSTVFVAVSIIIGVGFGLVEAGGSILARVFSGTGTARLLSALTGTVAIVASGVPLLLAFTPAGSRPELVFLSIGGVHLVALCFVLRTNDGVSNRSSSTPFVAEKEALSGRQGTRTRSLASVLVPVGFSLALYVGVETVYSGWSSTIPLLVLNVPAQHAAIGTSVFWLLLASGRYLATYLLSGSLSPRVYLLFSTSLAACALGVTAMTVSNYPVAATVSLGVAVIALGPCYSLILGIGLSGIPIARARWATGLFVACGAGGGALIPAVALAAADDPTSAGVFAVTGLLAVTSGFLVAVIGYRWARSSSASDHHDDRQT